MGDLSTKNANERDPACHVLAQAYCLRAFCNQEKEPNSKVFLEDIAKAEELWFMEEHNQFTEQNPLVSEYTFKLLHRVCNLLLIKDCMEDHHSDLYELMIKYCLWRSYSLEECMIMLWQSKSLCHSFCTSPINDVFLNAFSKHCPKYNSMKYWGDCFAMLKPTNVGFWNNMSIISPVPSQDYNDDEVIGQAKLYACDLIGKVHMSTKSVYLVANIFYDLGERMFAKGFMTEALTYASMAGRLRAGLCNSCFVYLVKNQDGNKKPIFFMDPLAATKAWSYDHEDLILNPYVILRCRLESMYQEANIMEILGKGDKSIESLRWGKHVSYLLGLPNFEARFSAALAKVYRKKQLWQEARLELHNLNFTSKQIACEKCKSNLQAILDQEAVDLVRQRINKTSHNMLFEEAITYVSAANKLKGIWESCGSMANNSKGKVYCASKCGCKVSIVSIEAYCWHCKPVEDMGPKPLRTIIGKNWEWAQRCHLLRLLIGIGKCFVVKGETERAHDVFLECICLIISMSTFFRTSSCLISFSFLFEFIEKNAIGDVNRKNVIEDVLGIELASLAYAISWFSLENYTGVR